MSSTVEQDIRKKLRMCGRKIGMTSIFKEDTGEIIPCTVIEIEDHVVFSYRREENEGYQAIQLGTNNMIGSSKRAIARHVKKPQREDYNKKDLPLCKTVFECKSVRDSFSTGDAFSAANVFVEGDKVDLSGISKGKGFQGVMKRYNMRGGPASHGCTKFHRKSGGAGGRSRPALTFKNTATPGRLGGYNATVLSSSVIRVVTRDMIESDDLIAEKGLNKVWLLVLGSVPGSSGAKVWIRHAVKSGNQER